MDILKLLKLENFIYQKINMTHSKLKILKNTLKNDYIII